MLIKTCAKTSTPLFYIGMAKTRNFIITQSVVVAGCFFFYPKDAKAFIPVQL